MVARILTGTNIRGLINYNESKVENGSADLILANRFGLDIDHLALRHKVARFEHLTKLNSKIKTNAMHIMLNFDPDEKIDVEKLQSIAATYMERIGFDEQPFLVYKHLDANHPHIHIVTTNVKADASRINIHNIGKTLSEKARKEIEVEYKLVSAEGRNKGKDIYPIDIDAASYGNKPTKTSIYNVVTAVLRSYKFTSLAEYNAVLRDFNLIADRGPEDSMMFQKRGLIYSILDTNGNRIGIPFKASSFAGRPTLNRVENKFSFNAEKRKLNAAPLKKLLTNILENQRVLSKELLRSALKKEGVSIHFRESVDGRMYGVTYVDHNTRSVFNGSDLGKKYSAKAILERCADNQIKTERTTRITKAIPSGKTPVLPDNKNEATLNYDVLSFLMEKPAVDPASYPVSTRKKKKKKLSKNITLSK